MTKLLNRTLALLGAVAALLAASAARAGSVQVKATYINDSPTEIVQITSGYLPSAYNGDYFYAGASNFQVANTAADIVDNSSAYNTTLDANSVRSELLQGGNSFQGYCIDLAHLIWGGTIHHWQVAYLTDVDIIINGHGITAAQQSAVQHLWADHGAASFSNAANSASFQMALWTLLYNNDPTHSTGVTFGAYGGNTAEIADAAAWATTAWGERATPSTAPIYALISTDGAQSFSVAIVGGASPNNVPSPVPLPAAAGVGFGMLGGFGLLAGIRKKIGLKSRLGGRNAQV